MRIKKKYNKSLRFFQEKKFNLLRESYFSMRVFLVFLIIELKKYITFFCC